MEPSIALTIDQQRRVLERARKRGLEPSAYLDALLADDTDEGAVATTGSHLVARLESEGVIGGWSARGDIGDSVAFARRLRRTAERRSARSTCVTSARCRA